MPGPAAKKSKKGLLIGGAVGLLALAGIGGALAASGGEDAAPATTIAATTDETPVPTTEAVDGQPTEETLAADAPGEEMPAATVAELARSTVQVLLLRGGTPVCSGSGTIVEADGTILTNAHVLDAFGGCEYDSVGIAVTDDPGLPPVLTYEADIYGYDATLDLAVVRIARDTGGNDVNETFPVIAVGDSDAVQIGDQIRILGYPSIGGDTVTFTNGVVSGFTAQAGVSERSWIKTDATIAGGNSGGTAVNAAGELIGIPTQAAASETGPIVDCRILADTNGDGSIDANDQCVPIGGFLNGIRPSALAADLLAFAATSEPLPLDPGGGAAAVAPDAPIGQFDLSNLRLWNPRFSLSATNDGPLPEFVETAERGTDTLCIWFDWEAMPGGVTWDGAWFLEGEIIESYSLFTQSWELGPDGSDNWVCALDENGIPAGLFEFAFYVDGDLQFIESIRLTETPVPVQEIEFVNNTGGTVCYFYVAPDGASDTGLDELGRTETLPAGGAIRVQIPEGRAIGEAFDCDLNRVWDARNGFAVNASGQIELPPG